MSFIVIDTSIFAYQGHDLDGFGNRETTGYFMGIFKQLCDHTLLIFATHHAKIQAGTHHHGIGYLGKSY